MGFIFKNFWTLFLTSLFVIALSSLIGALAIGIVFSVFCLGGLILRNLTDICRQEFQEPPKTLKEVNKKQKIEFKFLRVVFLSPFAILISIFLFSSALYILKEEMWGVINHIYDTNYWFLGRMYDLVPGIQNHTNFVLERDVNLSKIFEITLSSYYFFIHILVCAFLFNVVLLNRSIHHVLRDRQPFLMMLWVVPLLLLFVFSYFKLVHDTGINVLGFHGVGGTYDSRINDDVLWALPKYLSVPVFSVPALIIFTIKIFVDLKGEKQ